MLKIVFLGTGAAVPSANRWLPCIAVDLGSEVLVFDAGEAAQYRVISSSIGLSRISRVFITHMHGDHVLGLPGLIKSMHMNNRSAPLFIYGPPGIASYLESVFRATKFTPCFNVHVYEGFNIHVKTELYCVESFNVDHGCPALGYVLEVRKSRVKVDVEKLDKLGVPRHMIGALRRRGELVINGRVVRFSDVARRVDEVVARLVYTGDTRPTSSVVSAAEGADVLIHEATFHSSMEKEAHEEGHSTSKDAAVIAAEAKVKALVLTHISARYRDPRILESDARRFFRNSFVASDLSTLLI